MQGRRTEPGKYNTLPGCALCVIDLLLCCWLRSSRTKSSCTSRKSPSSCCSRSSYISTGAPSATAPPHARSTPAATTRYRACAAIATYGSGRLRAMETSACVSSSSAASAHMRLSTAAYGDRTVSSAAACSSMPRRTAAAKCGRTRSHTPPESASKRVARPTRPTRRSTQSGCRDSAVLDVRSQWRSSKVRAHSERRGEVAREYSVNSRRVRARRRAQVASGVMRRSMARRAAGKVSAATAGAAAAWRWCVARDKRCVRTVAGRTCWSVATRETSVSSVCGGKGALHAERSAVQACSGGGAAPVGGSATAAAHMSAATMAAKRPSTFSATMT